MQHSAQIRVAGSSSSTVYDATRCDCRCLVARSAMAASIPYACSCDGPPSAERHDAAIAAILDRQGKSR
jgi:hypothetical protein